MVFNIIQVVNFFNINNNKIDKYHLYEIVELYFFYEIIL